MSDHFPKSCSGLGPSWRVTFHVKFSSSPRSAGRSSCRRPGGQSSFRPDSQAWRVGVAAGGGAVAAAGNFLVPSTGGGELLEAPA